MRWCLLKNPRTTGPESSAPPQERASSLAEWRRPAGPCALLCCLFLTSSTASAVIIDRIAVVVGNSIVKDSDIERDLRVTEFLNGDALLLTPAARKKAADRLIDQAFVRREIRIGDYPTATAQDAEQQLSTIKREKFRTDTAFQDTLRRYGLDELALKTQFQWQLTVLQFIDARFRPAAYVSDDQIQKYYKEHTAALRRQFPGKSTLNDLRLDVQNILAGERVNQLFFAWLDEQRKSNKIQYFEAALRE